MMLILFIGAAVSTIRFSAGAVSASSVATTADSGMFTQHDVPDPDPEIEDLLLPQPVEDLPVVSDGRWSAGWTDNTWVALAAWVLLLLILELVGRPLARSLLSGFADQGRGFAKTITILLASYMVWILASLEIIAFRTYWSWIALALVAVVALVLHRRQQPPVLDRRIGLTGTGLFWGAFALFLIFRFINPDSWHPSWGGEKPMEFAHINAILRSAHFPPFDPWYADGYLNYYYFGTYQVAYLIKLTGIPAEIAFNLAQPTWMALLASAAFSSGSTLASLRAQAHRPAIAGGLIAAGFMVLAGNLVTPSKLIDTLPERPEVTFIGYTWASSRAISGGITEFPYFTGLYADLHAHLLAMPLLLLAVALACSMVLQPFEGSRRSGRLLDARMLVLALGLGALAATNAWDVPIAAAIAIVCVGMATDYRRRWRDRILIVATLSVVVALLAFITFKPFFDNYQALFSEIARVRSQTDFWEAAWHAGGLLAICWLAAIVLLGRRASDEQGTIVAAATVLTIAVIAAAFVLRHDYPRESDWMLTIGLSFAAVSLLVAALTALRSTAHNTAIVLAGSLLTALVAALAWFDYQTLALYLVAAAAGALLWWLDDVPRIRLAGLLLAAAGSIGAGVEIVYVVDDLDSLEEWYRMNTIFKFYNQFWLLLSLALAGLTVQALVATQEHAERLESTAIVDDRFRTTGWRQPGGLAHGRAMLVSVVVIVAIASFAYPLMASRPRFEQRFVGHPDPDTLNALDWMTYGTIRNDQDDEITFVGDLAAIDWFNETVDGSPVIAEASIGPYIGGGSRISVNTGLPSVLGWERHEQQQRYDDFLDQRYRDLLTLYRSDDLDEKLAIIDRYNIRYVVVGDVERRTILGGALYASAEGLASLEAMVGDTLEIAFESNGTTVYRVVS